MCEIGCGTESELLLHEEQVHKKSKFLCDECQQSFASGNKLREHKQHKHSVITWYPCDHCGYKSGNFVELHYHI